MSNQQYAFIEKTNVPNKDLLQRAIDSLNFGLKLDPEFTPFEDEGFSPCILNDDSDVGFEIYYESAEDVIDGDSELKRIAGGRDLCISMCWGSSLKDMASVMIVSAALARDFGAVISYEGEEPETIDSLVSGAAQALRDAEMDGTTSDKAKSEQEERYSSDENIDKDFEKSIRSLIGSHLVEAIKKPRLLQLVFDNGSWVRTHEWILTSKKFGTVDGLINSRITDIRHQKSTVVIFFGDKGVIECMRKNSGFAEKQYNLLFSSDFNVTFEIHWSGPSIVR